MTYEMTRAKRLQAIREIAEAHWPLGNGELLNPGGYIAMVNAIMSEWDDDIENLAAEAAERLATVKNDLEQAIGFLWRQS